MIEGALQTNYSAMICSKRLRRRQWSIRLWTFEFTTRNYRLISRCSLVWLEIRKINGCWRFCDSWEVKLIYQLGRTNQVTHVYMFCSIILSPSPSPLILFPRGRFNSCVAIQRGLVYKLPHYMYRIHPVCC